MAREIQIKGIGSLPWLEVDKDSLGVFIKAVDIADTASLQPLAADLNVLAAVGTSTATVPAYIAAMMGNILGASLTKTANYLAGVYGKYSVSGARSTTFPAGGVVGEAAGRCHGAVVALLGVHDDPNEAQVGAAFKVMSDNWTVPSDASGRGFAFGLDLQIDVTRSGQSYVNGYNKGDIRLGGDINGTAAGNDVLIMRKAGAPTNGTSGDGAANAGPGSLLIDTTNAKLYINTNTKASPTWTIVGTQVA